MLRRPQKPPARSFQAHGGADGGILPGISGRKHHFHGFRRPPQGHFRERPARIRPIASPIGLPFLPMNLFQRAGLYLMATLYVIAGVLHFVRPAAYLPMMPAYLPAHLALIYASGLAEVLGGLGLLWPRTRRAAAWGLVALLLAVWPANLHIALENVPLFGATEGAGPWNWVRVVFQVPLILWAWLYTRPGAPVARNGATEEEAAQTGVEEPAPAPSE